MEHELESERALNSLDGVQRVAMPQALRQRIIAAMPLGIAQVFALRRPFVLLIAAGLMLLIVLNVYSLVHSGAEKPGSTTIVQANPLSDEYFSPAPSI